MRKRIRHVEVQDLVTHLHRVFVHTHTHTLKHICESIPREFEQGAFVLNNTRNDYVDNVRSVKNCMFGHLRGTKKVDQRMHS